MWSSVGRPLHMLPGSVGARALLEPASKRRLVWSAVGLCSCISIFFAICFPTVLASGVGRTRSTELDSAQQYFTSQGQQSARWSTLQHGAFLLMSHIGVATLVLLIVNWLYRHQDKSTRSQRMASVGDLQGQAKDVEDDHVMSQHETGEMSQHLKDEEHDFANPLEGIDMKTPAEKLLCMLSSLAQQGTEGVAGQVLGEADILELQNLLLNGADVYQPVKLEEKLISSGMLKDIGMNLALTLGQGDPRRLNSMMSGRDDTAVPAAHEGMSGVSNHQINYSMDEQSVVARYDSTELNRKLSYRGGYKSDLACMLEGFDGGGDDASDRITAMHDNDSCTPCEGGDDHGSSMKIQAQRIMRGVLSRFMSSKNLADRDRTPRSQHPDMPHKPLIAQRSYDNTCSSISSMNSSPFSRVSRSWMRPASTHSSIRKRDLAVDVNRTSNQSGSLNNRGSRLDENNKSATSTTSDVMDSLCRDGKAFVDTGVCIKLQTALSCGPAPPTPTLVPESMKIPRVSHTESRTSEQPDLEGAFMRISAESVNKMSSSGSGRCRVQDGVATTVGVATRASYGGGNSVMEGILEDPKSDYDHTGKCQQDAAKRGGGNHNVPAVCGGEGQVPREDEQLGPGRQECVSIQDSVFVQDMRLNKQRISCSYTITLGELGTHEASLNDVVHDDTEHAQQPKTESCAVVESFTLDLKNREGCQSKGASPTQQVSATDARHVEFPALATAGSACLQDAPDRTSPSGNVLKRGRSVVLRKQPSIADRPWFSMCAGAGKQGLAQAGEEEDCQEDDADLDMFPWLFNNGSGTLPPSLQSVKAVATGDNSQGGGVDGEGQGKQQQQGLQGNGDEGGQHEDGGAVSPICGSRGVSPSDDDYDVCTVPPALLTSVETMLANVDDWGFNMFALHKETQGHPLSCLAFFLITRAGFVQEFNMDPWALARYLYVIESGYLANPYHNKTHAAHVLHRLHMLLTHGGFQPYYADRLTTLGCYLAATIHDFEHLGVGNDFLIAAQDILAFLYNDKAPLENHHLAAAWTLTRESELNFLSRMGRQDFDRLRKLVIDLVLATDMKLHFSLCGQFSTIHSATINSGASTSLPGNISIGVKQRSSRITTTTGTATPSTPATATSTAAVPAAPIVPSEPGNGHIGIQGIVRQKGPSNPGNLTAGFLPKFSTLPTGRGSMPGMLGLAGREKAGLHGIGSPCVSKISTATSSWQSTPRSGIFACENQNMGPQPFACGAHISAPGSATSAGHGSGASSSCSRLGMLGSFAARASKSAVFRSAAAVAAAVVDSPKRSRLSASGIPDLTRLDRMCMTDGGAGPHAVHAEHHAVNSTPGVLFEDPGIEQPPTPESATGSHTMTLTHGLPLSLEAVPPVNTTMPRKTTQQGSASQPATATTALARAIGSEGHADHHQGDAGDVFEDADGCLRKCSRTTIGSACRSSMAGTCHADDMFVCRKPVDENERILSLQMALKAADICNLCDPRTEHIQWVMRLEEEFFRQGDAEKRLGLNVSPLYDRCKPGVSTSQVAFMEVVAIPLFKHLATVFSGAVPLLNGLMSNHSYWKGLDDLKALHKLQKEQQEKDAPCDTAAATTVNDLAATALSTGSGSATAVDYDEHNATAETRSTQT